MWLDRVIAVRNDKLVYRDGDRCIKVFRQGYAKADVLHEARNHAEAEAAGLPVPELLEVTQIDGKWALVLSYVKGRTLAERMTETPQQREACLMRLAELRQRIHRARAPRLERLEDKLLQRIAESGLDGDTVSRLQEAVSREATRHPVGVCHGDLQPSNVVECADGSYVILDWSHAAEGNPVWDVALTTLSFLLAGDREGAMVYAATFCREDASPLSCITARIPAVAAARLARCRAREREALRAYAEGNATELF